MSKNRIIKTFGRKEFINGNQSVENSVKELEQRYGQLVQVLAIMVNDDTSCLVRKFEQFYLINIIKGQSSLYYMELTYPLFYAWYLIADKLVTIEDKKQFLAAMEVTNNDRKTI